MKQEGISTTVVVAVVIVVAIVVGGFSYLLLKGESSPGDLPVYPGAIEEELLTAQVKMYLGYVELSGIEAGAYSSSQDVTTITSWYRSKMDEFGWTKENDIPAIDGGGLLIFKQGDYGVLLAVDNYNSPSDFVLSKTAETVFLILYSQFDTITSAWEKVFGIGTIPDNYQA